MAVGVCIYVRCVNIRIIEKCVEFATEKVVGVYIYIYIYIYAHLACVWVDVCMWGCVH